MHEEVLDNGLRVLIQEMHTAPLASVWCWYRVGSKDERPGLTGVSHWCEHMNFKGTRNIPRDQVKGIIEKFGGSWNGYTWIDQTTYLETASKDALDRMLFIEAERMDACGTALATGVPFAIHCDAPVTPIGPLFTAWCAVNRLTATGRTLGNAEKISVADALRADGVMPNALPLSPERIWELTRKPAVEFAPQARLGPVPDPAGRVTPYALT